MGIGHWKSCGAIVTVRLEGSVITFGLEYERTAKSEGQYAEMLNNFDSEKNPDRFLCIASSKEVMRFVFWQF